MNDSVLEKLFQLNVRDSKRISDNVIKKLDERIKSICVWTTVAIGPERYNELYGRMQNLNRMLAWGHARAIENLLEKEDCPRAVTDQFGDERFVINALLKRGKQIKIQQRPKAEDDLAVAAASVIARAEFVSRLEGLSDQIGEELLKGASGAVEELAQELVERYGEGILKKVAKVHFKTTQKVIGKSKRGSG